MFRPKYLTGLDQIPQLLPTEKEKLQKVCDSFAFRANEYYQSLINWDDPDDPIRRIVIPHTRELAEDEGERWSLDASGEEEYTKVPGLQHKYEKTALLLVNDICSAYCRFCFRKRLFMDGNDEVVRDISKGITYIKKHKAINNVILSGGDLLILSTVKLERIISRLREIKHLKIIRIGSKIPAFNPYRILNDPTLIKMLSKYSTDKEKIYIIAHFNHPRELTQEAIAAINMFQKAGIVTINQTPLILGVNDDPDVLSELLEQLSFIGVSPYYVFQCRPTKGNKIYSLPIEEGLDIFEKAIRRVSGLGSRARYVMSHHMGKMEIVGRMEEHIIFRYHRDPDMDDPGQIMMFESDSNAYWLDDYIRD